MRSAVNKDQLAAAGAGRKGMGGSPQSPRSGAAAGATRNTRPVRSDKTLQVPSAAKVATEQAWLRFSDSNQEATAYTGIWLTGKKPTEPTIPLVRTLLKE